MSAAVIIVAVMLASSTAGSSVAASPPPSECVKVTIWTWDGERTADRCLPIPRPEPEPRPTPGTDPPPSGDRQGLATNCTYIPGPEYSGGDVGIEDISHFRMNNGVLEMHWAERCVGRETDRWYWRPVNGTPEAPEIPPPTPADLVPGAFDHVRRQLPDPVPVIAPADRDPDGFTYVQIPTVFWVEQRAGQWAPVSATSSVAGLSVTVTATPERMLVDTGDGGHVDCPGAPPALGPNSSLAGFHGCSYVYENSSAMSPNGLTFPVTVSIVWHATWQASNGETGDLGTLTTTSPVRDLPVAEIQVVVTG